MFRPVFVLPETAEICRSLLHEGHVASCGWQPLIEKLFVQAMATESFEPECGSKPAKLYGVWKW